MEYVQFEELSYEHKKIVSAEIMEAIGEEEKYRGVSSFGRAKELIDVGAFSLIKTISYLRVVKSIKNIHY